MMTITFLEKPKDCVVKTLVFVQGYRSVIHVVYTRLQRQKEWLVVHGYCLNLNLGAQGQRSCPGMNGFILTCSGSELIVREAA